MRTIVLIEDNADSARLVMRTLKPYSVKVLHASDGEQGLLLIGQHHPDLILLDLGLPDLEGQTLAAIIKNTPELAETPLIAVTAWPPETGEAMARAYGCDGYIAKPISPRQFPAQLAAFVDLEPLNGGC